MKWQLAVALLLGSAAMANGKAHSAGTEKQGRLIIVHAMRYSFEPAEITLEKGEPVTIELISEDVLHSLAIRDLGLNLKDSQIGQGDSMTVTPQEDGDFKGVCGVFCGVGHGKMALTVHVVDAR